MEERRPDADDEGRNGGAPLDEKLGATAKGVGLGALGIVGIYVYAIVVGLTVRGITGGPIDISLGAVLSTLASGAGTLTVVALYLRWSDRDRSFLDIRVPGLRGIGLAVIGTLGILTGNLVIGLAFRRAGIQSASHTILRAAEASPEILLVLIPLSFLVIAPGEELLYRNVIQKSLRSAFSPVAGVVVASAIFAAVHLPAYSNPDGTLAATLSTLIVIFVLALILGALYEYTRNVVVSILAHGAFNAIAFAWTYARLTGMFGM